MALGILVIFTACTVLSAVTGSVKEIILRHYNWVACNSIFAVSVPAMAFDLYESGIYEKTSVMLTLFCATALAFIRLEGNSNLFLSEVQEENIKNSKIAPFLFGYQGNLSAKASLVFAAIFLIDLYAYLFDFDFLGSGNLQPEIGIIGILSTASAVICTIFFKGTGLWRGIFDIITGGALIFLAATSTPIAYLSVLLACGVYFLSSGIYLGLHMKEKDNYNYE